MVKDKEKIKTKILTRICRIRFNAILFSRDSTGELPRETQTESSAVENVLSKLKSIAHLRMAETKTPAANSITREELEALRDLLDRNLQKYQNYGELSARKRPNNDPYIGQILENLNEQKSDGLANEPTNMPVRRKIIRHTVFATPLNRGGGGGTATRVYGQNGDGITGSRIDWSSPWADYFPILIRDPFQTMLNSFSEIVEYGPAADICRHGANGGGDEIDRKGRSAPERTATATLKRSRRNTGGGNEETEKGVLNHVRPFKSTTTERPKLHGWAPQTPSGEHNGDMGPQIKRLIVRRGGVAIAGPGGIATAGSGGTAIVGPGGSAYSSKDTAAGSTSEHMPGMSVAGYGPHVMHTQQPYPYYAPYPPTNGFGRSMDKSAKRSAAAKRTGVAEQFEVTKKSADDVTYDGGTALLSSDGVAYTFPVPSRGLTTDADRGAGAPPFAASTAREISLPDGAKLIATGPIVYYNPERAAATDATVVAKKRSRKGGKTSKKSTNESNKKRAVGQQRPLF